MKKLILMMLMGSSLTGFLIMSDSKANVMGREFMQCEFVGFDHLGSSFYLQSERREYLDEVARSLEFISGEVQVTARFQGDVEDSKFQVDVSEYGSVRLGKVSNIDPRSSASETVEILQTEMTDIWNKKHLVEKIRVSCTGFEG